jgi:signal transduction histidine kinase
MALVPLSIGVAILRGRLYDVDLLINRTLVYGALTACVVGTYILVVGYLGALFQARGDAVSLIAAGLAAVLFQPLRQRFQRGVNRLLYGQRDEPYAVLSRLGQRLEATLAPEAVLPTIVSTVREALKLPFVAITLGPHDAPAVVTESGTPVADPLRLALVYRGEPIGHLLLGPRALNEPFTPADRRLLEDLAHQAGVAAHAVRLTADLQRSRERLVSAREEERRRLRRDLHDGLGPALAAHTLKVGTARALLPHAAVAADRLLAELEDDIEAAVTDIRRLVYNLRPPALDELGLVGAIRESTAQYDGHPDGSPGGVVIRVEAPEWLPPLPAAVEVATYRILQEALANVFRHAQAQTCRVELRVGRALRLAVTDDGVGLSPMRHAGVGLVSMRERAEELGGSCLVEPAPGGGTRVVAELPLLPSTEELPGATWLGGSESGTATAHAAVMARR